MKVDKGYIILLNEKDKKMISYKIKESMSLVNKGRIVLTAKCKLTTISGDFKEVKEWN